MFQGSYPQLFLEKFKKDLTLFFFVYIKNGRNELIENKRGKNMGFFDKLSSMASKCVSIQANRYDSAARSGYVGDRKLTSEQRDLARFKAAECRELVEKYRK